MFVCKILELTSSIFCLCLTMASLYSPTHAYDISRLSSVARYPVGYDPDNRTRPQFVQPLTRPRRTDRDATNTSPPPLHEASPTPPPSPRRVNARSPVTAEERSRFYNLLAQTSLASLGVMDSNEAYTNLHSLTPPKQHETPKMGIYRPEIRDTRFHGRHKRRWQPPRGYDPRKRPTIEDVDGTNEQN